MESRQGDYVTMMKFNETMMESVLSFVYFTSFLRQISTEDKIKIYNAKIYTEQWIYLFHMEILSEF